VQTGVRRSLQPKVSSQCRGLVGGAEQSATLEFGHDYAHDAFERAGQMRSRQHETVAGAVFEPVRYLIGDLLSVPTNRGPCSRVAR
jgi:hypothetical protein